MRYSNTCEKAQGEGSRRGGNGKGGVRVWDDGMEIGEEGIVDMRST